MVTSYRMRMFTDIQTAGYRLAALLNLILVGEPALAVPGDSSVPMCNTTAITNIGSS